MYNFFKDFDLIIKDVFIFNFNYGDDICWVEEIKKYVDFLFLRNMCDVVVSFFFLVIFMFIIYIVLVCYKIKYIISGFLLIKKIYCIIV